MKPPNIVTVHFLSTKWSKKLFTINHYELQNSKCIVTQELSAYLVYANSKKGPFFTYQFHAGIENFQHLAGIKSPNGAEWFFKKCLNNENPLTRKDIVPKENIKNTSSKISVLSDAVDLTKSKAYRLGKKDKITLHNAFEVAIGNTNHVMGLDKRNRCHFAVPVTVMDRSIYDFCSNGLTIYLIMTKNVLEDKYSNIFYEITQNILDKADFQENVWNLIDYKKNEKVEKTLTFFKEIAVASEKQQQ